MKVLNAAKTRRQAGFSIAELMVVILIIGLLATQVVPRVLSSLGDAKWGKAKADITAIANALEQFAIKNGGDFPESLERLVERDENGNSFLKQTEVPRDPWDAEYVYMPPEGTRDFELWTYGKDGSPGGEGDDRDLSFEMVLNNQE